MSQPYQPYQPIPYGQPYPPAPPEHPQGPTVLVLGILGLVLPVVAPAAWYIGSRSTREIRASGVTYANEQSITIGRILGMVITLLMALAAVFFVVSMLILFGMAAAFGA